MRASRDYNDLLAATEIRKDGKVAKIAEEEVMSKAVRTGAAVRKSLLCALCVLSGLWASSALALDWKKETIPEKWIEPLVPEDLEPLEHPSYFNDVDKARAQAFAGRYRLALVTLAKAKNADP